LLSDSYKGSCVIVDDELRSRNNIALIIKEYLPGLEILGAADSAKAAREILSALVFVTAFEKYALRAIKVSAIDYVVKPISIADLQVAAKKGLAFKGKGEILDQQIYQQSLSNFLHNLETKEYPKEITLPNKGSFVIRETAELVCLIADNNYTNFVFEDGENILVAKTMKFYAEVLNPECFVRCSRSVIVNCKFLSSISEDMVHLKNQTSYSISRRKKKDVLEVFKNYQNNKK